jgi:hypothetical protein
MQNKTPGYQPMQSTGMSDSSGIKNLHDVLASQSATDKKKFRFKRG